MCKDNPLKSSMSHSSSPTSVTDSPVAKHEPAGDVVSEDIATSQQPVNSESQAKPVPGKRLIHSWPL